MFVSGGLIPSFLVVTGWAATTVVGTDPASAVSVFNILVLRPSTRTPQPT